MCRWRNAGLGYTVGGSKECVMANMSQDSEAKTFREALGLAHLFRTLGLAVEPRNLLIALLGLWATLFYGGWLLDPLWHGLKSRGCLVSCLPPKRKR